VHFENRERRSIIDGLIKTTATSITRINNCEIYIYINISARGNVRRHKVTVPRLKRIESSLSKAWKIIQFILVETTTKTL